MLDVSRVDDYQVLLDSLAQARRRLGSLKRFSRTNGPSEFQQRQELSCIGTINCMSRLLREAGVMDGYERLTPEAKQLELQYAA